MVKINNTGNTKSWQGYGKTETSYIVGEHAKWYSKHTLIV